MMKSLIKSMTKLITTTALLTIVLSAFGNAQTFSPKKPATPTAVASATPQNTQKKATLPTMEEVEA